MEVLIRSCAAVFILASVMISHVISVPANEAEVPSGSFAAEKRPKYLDTRELDGDLNELIYAAILQLVGDGRLDSAVLPADKEDKEDNVKRNSGHQAAKRWYQGICHKRGNTGQLVAYFCAKQKRGFHQSVCYRRAAGRILPYLCTKSI